MVFAVSGGSLRSLERPLKPSSFDIQIAPELTLTYAEIYRRQPEVRTVVDFLARNIAQLSLHTFQRVGETDRKRLRDHPLAVLLGRPNANTTPYRFMRALVADRGIYDVAYWLKSSDPDTGKPALIRLPPRKVKPDGDDWLEPEKFVLKGDQGKAEFAAKDVVYFRGYNPVDPRVGLSPMESLRRILSESYEASRMREQVLRNGARVSGYIERPKDAGDWSPEARGRFKSGWRAQYTGHSATEGGGTPVLEDGMKFVPASQNAVDLQYVEARMLTREEVAAAYHIPPPMVGILDKATFSNIEQQHKMLYQDTLGPWLQEIQQEIILQLLPDFENTDGIYVEFNLAEKLRGSFEEQAASLSSSVGRPFMTADEARGRLNLPSLGGDAAALVTPLNVLTGGQASPRDSGSQNRAGGPRPSVKAAGRAMKSADVDPSEHVRAVENVLKRFYGRQRDVVLSRLGAKASGSWWDAARWDDELTADLFRVAVSTTGKIGKEQAAALGFSGSDYDEERTLAFLQAVAKSRATAINATTKQRLDDALDEDEPDPGQVFDEALSARTASGSTALVSALAGFAVMEAGKQLVGSKATKTWVVTSGNPRPEHAAMDGETVPIEDDFSNGATWPGDPTLGADGVAGCMCALQINY